MPFTAYKLPLWEESNHEIVGALQHTNYDYFTMILVKLGSSLFGRTFKRPLDQAPRHPPQVLITTNIK